MKLFAAILVLGSILPAAATPSPYDTPRNEQLGAQCEGGHQESCRALVTETAGNCAGPTGSGCRYSLEVVNPPEPMVVVPGLRHLGSSRISTVLFCVESELGRGKDWRNLITDSDFELIEGCLRAHT